MLLWARQDLNLQPTDYESAALTVELRALVVIDVERLVEQADEDADLCREGADADAVRYTAYR